MRRMKAVERTLYIAMKKAQVLARMLSLLSIMTAEDVFEMTPQQQMFLAQTLARMPEEIPSEIVNRLQGALLVLGVAA